MSDTTTPEERAELAEVIDDLLVFHHKGKICCLTFAHDRVPIDDRRLLTALRVLRAALEVDDE